MYMYICIYMYLNAYIEYTYIGTDSRLLAELTHTANIPAKNTIHTHAQSTYTQKYVNMHIQAQTQDLFAEFTQMASMYANHTSHHIHTCLHIHIQAQTQGCSQNLHKRPPCM